MGRMYMLEYTKAGDYKREIKKFCSMDSIARYLNRLRADRVLAVSPVHRKLKVDHRTDFIISLMNEIKLKRIDKWSNKQIERLDYE